MMAEYLVAECWIGPTVAGLTASLAEAGVAGTAQGAFSTLAAVGNIAPVVIGGMVSAEGVGGLGLWANTSLGDSMTAVICSSYVISGVLFGMAALSFRTPAAAKGADR
uniref:Uncharacterized protein n=1 Tax=Pyramimonas obovata TaxID=1411642 RepID=A0A7S0QST9_9CHLO|mmetsp:Transcript_13122/g.27772  ORF Transcript_13122/g.27772 Transcript_13122/m.27772 type:complete len:108 (+) Transcript_13122:280-603(+)